MSKPRCPFCGRKLEVRKEHEEGGWSAYCTHCTMDAGHFDSEEQLRETFSNRPEKPMPCPLCGKEPEVYVSVWERKRYYTIRCHGCRMDMGQMDDERKAVRTWNKRRK